MSKYVLICWLMAQMVSLAMAMPFQDEDYENLYRPTFLAIHPSGELYVVDNGNHRIVVMDAKGTYKRSFGRKGMGPGEFQWPSSVGFLNEQEVYVADSQKRKIYVFHRDGKFIKELFDVDHPLGFVHLNEQGQFMVTESDGYLFQFSMDPENKSAPIRIYSPTGTLLGKHGATLTHKIPFIASQRNHGSLAWFGDRLVFARMVENHMEIFGENDTKTLSYAPAFPPKEPDGKMKESKQPDGSISYQMVAETDAHCLDILAIDAQNLLMLRAKGPEKEGVVHSQLVVVGWDGKLVKTLPGTYQAKKMAFNRTSKTIYLIDENDDGWFIRPLPWSD